VYFFLTAKVKKVNAKIKEGGSFFFAHFAQSLASFAVTGFFNPKVKKESAKVWKEKVGIEGKEGMRKERKCWD
jgi:hypothetical protein